MVPGSPAYDARKNYNAVKKLDKETPAQNATEHCLLKIPVAISSRSSELFFYLCFTIVTAGIVFLCSPLYKLHLFHKVKWRKKRA